MPRQATGAIAGTVAARRAGVAELVDPRPYAVGSIALAYAAYPALGPVLPAMGYGEDQLAELEATIRATPCDVVVVGTPVDLGRVVDAAHPIRHVHYESEDKGDPTLSDVLAPPVSRDQEALQT